MSQNFGLYIDGKWRGAPGGATTDVLSPVTQRALGAVPVATTADTPEALVAAGKGFAALRTTAASAGIDAL
ncbi:NAD-dependent succinate-semialdehyde dehydrogenase, partial [Rhizobium ruizarguesonis]